MTEKITLQELVRRMREMEIGTAVDLQDGDAGIWFGIRRLPDDMFDNGRNWIAGCYGGSCTQAFSDSPYDDYGELTDALAVWLNNNDLLTVEGNEEKVTVEIKDGSEPETKWSFAKTIIPPKNKLASVSFILTRSYQTHISVPPHASDDEIVELAKAALIDCTKDKFDSSVTDADAKHWDVWPEDFVDMVVNHDCKLRTNLPTGALSK